MPVGRTQAVALLGLQGAIVEIEADYSSQLPKFVLIGLPDAALGEARDRVLAAAANSGCDLPSRRLTRFCLLYSTLRSCCCSGEELSKLVTSTSRAIAATTPTITNRNLLTITLSATALF